MAAKDLLKLIPVSRADLPDLYCKVVSGGENDPTLTNAERANRPLMRNPTSCRYIKVLSDVHFPNHDSAVSPAADQPSWGGLCQDCHLAVRQGASEAITICGVGPVP